jgi:DNA-directed RNA polymerase subunit K/omega
MPELSEIEFNATRLRRVAKLVGLESAVPEDDKTLIGCMGSVLGMVARAIEDERGKPVSKALTDVAAERARQIEVEGWTAAHDDEHADGSLTEAAITYALAANEKPAERAVLESFGFTGLRDTIQSAWPTSWCSTWFKPKSRRRDLVRAAALLVAEIDRLDRAAIAATPAQKEK